MASTATFVDKLSTVVIPVADQDQMIQFYTEKLGFEKRLDVPFGGQYRWVEVGPPDGETSIALAPPAPGGSSGNRETGIGLHAADIDGYHADLKAKGADVDAEVARLGDPVPPMFFVRDPEGNSLMVVG